ncbi:MAG: hypothetical protein IGQ88_04735 [Gloeomargaritaceae cyanobacterium C42_A2020_066]|nr:hypothetical protein [Gloeomargaritaceae cyanobacterium C42_A2020_066]
MKTCPPSPKIVCWTAGTTSSGNLQNLQDITRWWLGLANQEVTWQLRTRPAGVPPEDLDWSLQPIDEVFTLREPQFQGWQLRWRQAESGQVDSVVVMDLELDQGRQVLDLVPQGRSDLVIRVRPLRLSFDIVHLENPRILWERRPEGYRLILQQPNQGLEVQVDLDATAYEQLRGRSRGTTHPGGTYPGTWV